MTSPAIADLAKSFRRSLRAAGKADRTIVLYEQSIRFFLDWLAAGSKEATLAEFTRANIQLWLEALRDKGNSHSTVATRFRGLRRFDRWLVAEGETDARVTESFELADAPEEDPRVLTDEEIEKILKACATARGKGSTYSVAVFDKRRDEVIVRLLIDCGIRCAEIANLKLDDVDLDQELVFVVGKGNRPRAVPFSAKTAQAIDRYVRIRNGHPKTRSDRLLLTQRGPISTDGVRWRVELLGEAIGIPDLHPHAFRHTFSHRWLANGGQERDLMMLAGWRSEQMLKVYARSTAKSRAHDAHRRMRRDDMV